MGDPEDEDGEWRMEDGGKAAGGWPLPSSIFHPPSSPSSSRRRVGGVSELIPEAADGLDAVGGVAEFSADRGDVNVDRAVEDVGIAAEGGVDDVVARQDTPGLAGEE